MTSFSVINSFINDTLFDLMMVSISIICLVFINLLLWFKDKKTPLTKTTKATKKPQEIIENIHSKSNPPWVDEEIIVVLDFYHAHAPNIPSKKSIEIYELSTLIRELQIHNAEDFLTSFRNENGIYLKLMNLASLDPSYTGKGMGNASNADKKIWDKYINRIDQLQKDAEKIKLYDSEKKISQSKANVEIIPDFPLRNIVHIYKQSSECNQCFDKDKTLKRDKIFGGQPRWVGSKYFNQEFKNPRTVILLRSPGLLGKSTSFSINRYKALLRDLEQLKSWEEMMKMIDADSSNWGNFDEVYKERMELDLDFSAFLNIGLCSGFNAEISAAKTKDHLKHCFNMHSRKILEYLQPQVLILSGAIVRDIYYEEVRDGDQESKNLIEKNFISNEFFDGEAIRMASYAARGPYVKMKAEEIGEEIRMLGR